MANNNSLTVEPFDGLTDLVAVYRDNLESIMKLQEELIAQMPRDVIAKAGGAKDADERLSEAEKGISELEAAIAARDMTGYMSERRRRVQLLADAGIPFDLIARSIVSLMEPLGELTLSAFPDDSQRGLRARHALDWLKSEMLIISGQAYAGARESMIEDEYQKVIRGLSTPVIEVWENILVMPLIGVIDSGRARQIMEQLLDRIVALQSEIVILDITGVPMVDSDVADHLVRTTRAAELVGARTILVGISPQVAQTLVRLGVSLAGVETGADLRSGLETAFGHLGYELVHTE